MSDVDEPPGEGLPEAARLARTIKALREEAGLSQPKLGAAIGYTRQYVSLAERLGQNLPSFELVKSIDNVLRADGALIALRQLAKRERQALRAGSTATSEPAPASRARVSSCSPHGSAFAHLPDLADHLSEQWHLLVKTDNLFGPRFALGPVHSHLRLVTEAMSAARGAVRRDLVRLAARYAESAAWLHEDADEDESARYWTDRAMEWAHESDDRLMLSWTLFRSSQQAGAASDAARALGLAQAARRDEEVLTAPMRAAIAQQEAHGHALDGDEAAAQRKLDEAHEWAASDSVGEARDGHGSFCTPAYLELQRAACWLAAGRPDRAVRVYEETLPTLPSAYRRDRGLALSRFATAAARVDEPEYAVHLAEQALDIARSAGSARTEKILRTVVDLLAPRRSIPAVAAFSNRLDGGL
ncbi:helix-turn-helix transcriptional regulator [Actinosynnema sp. NPDC047251]|uniref:HTH cro/C1-type domain-containing protein n=1 Tax=Saccharothrix espanaensis (strain ATCC 51144 / DSM 44229 / JCM 9112 / NBRC 15066 / NRRL 15764) TaxID=1179773 RepID=K0JUX8_SACES|nr:helix-turn-helix transcriptional regulator [Saccharothrix espanaensis]CCH29322.1 hypothetical protein BN6_20010 [Saccharothrix espanaensis DSM 44229]